MIPSSLRRPLRARARATVLAAALAASACAYAAPPSQNAATPDAARSAAGDAGNGAADGAATSATNAGAVRLPPQGPLAFHPQRDELAWAQGRDAYRLDLASGRSERLRAGAAIADLAYADDGALWLAAGAPERWQAGRRACRGDGVDLSRVFGADRGGGARMASYGYADGQGPIRHQYWLDARCRVRRDSVAPLPAGVRDSAADPGETPAAADAHAARLRNAAQPAADGVVAASRDGRWQVVERGGERRLERRFEPAHAADNAR